MYMSFLKVSFSIFAFFIACQFSAEAQVGKMFPDMSGLTLTDQETSLPQDSKGKYTLVGLAFSKKSEDDLRTWFQPVYYKFIQKAENPGLFDFSYDVNLYFVPMFSGINQAVAGKATQKMKEGIDKELLPHVLIYKGNIKEYKESLDLDSKDKPYFFVLDETGKIVYATDGSFSEKKLEQIEEQLP